MKWITCLIALIFALGITGPVYAQEAWYELAEASSDGFGYENSAIKQVPLGECHADIDEAAIHSLRGEIKIAASFTGFAQVSADTSVQDAVPGIPKGEGEVPDPESEPGPK